MSAQPSPPPKDVGDPAIPEVGDVLSAIGPMESNPIITLASNILGLAKIKKGKTLLTIGIACLCCAICVGGTLFAWGIFKDILKGDQPKSTSTSPIFPLLQTSTPGALCTGPFCDANAAQGETTFLIQSTSIVPNTEAPTIDYCAGVPNCSLLVEYQTTINEVTKDGNCATLREGINNDSKVLGCIGNSTLVTVYAVGDEPDNVEFNHNFDRAYVCTASGECGWVHAGTLVRVPTKNDFWRPQ